MSNIHISINRFYIINNMKYYYIEKLLISFIIIKEKIA